jgi:hypothetical protein
MKWGGAGFSIFRQKVDKIAPSPYAQKVDKTAPSPTVRFNKEEVA